MEGYKWQDLEEHMRRPANKEEKKHLASVVGNGCAICGSPAEAHHIIDNETPKRNHLVTIALCPYHHRTGGNGYAIHAGKKSWRENFGHERGYLAKRKA